MDIHLIGDAYEFLPLSHELIVKVDSESRKIKLEPLISDLLLVFVQQSDEVILRSQLIEQLWQGNEEVGDPALTKSIFKLRKLFGSSGKAMFQTVSKRGYRFNSKINLENPMINTISNLRKRSYSKIIIVLLLFVLAIALALIIDPKLWHKITH